MIKVAQGVYDSLGKKTARSLLKSEFMSWATILIADFAVINIDTIFDNIIVKGIYSVRPKSKQSSGVTDQRNSPSNEKIKEPIQVSNESQATDFDGYEVDDSQFESEDKIYESSNNNNMESESIKQTEEFSSELNPDGSIAQNSYDSNGFVREDAPSIINENQNLPSIISASVGEISTFDNEDS
jgi:hypothetical protein